MECSQHAGTPSHTGSSSTNGTLEVKRQTTPAKHEKAIQQEYDQHVKEIRNQLSEQLKCVGERTETQISVLSELEDYFRRRGEVEMEHAKQLEKLAKGIMHRHKAERTKRESWQQHGACSVWQQLVDDAKTEAKERFQMAELFGKTVTSSISQRCDDLARISKRCREIGALSHSEINRVLTELHTSMKTYQICYTESSAVEKKLRIAEDDVRRYEESNQNRLDSRKHKNLIKYHKKRLEKYEAVRTKCTKARNEYLMCVRAANAAMHRFFAQDLSYLIDCMDLGVEFWIRNLLDHVIESRKKITQKEMEALGELDTLKSSLDSKADKQRFFEANHSLFMLPRQFEFRPHLGDTVTSVSVERTLSSELQQRQKQIEKRLEGLRFESDEVWKSLEACERQLFTLYKECDTEDGSKWRSDLLVSYQYYLKKFEYFLLNGNLIERLEARSKAIVDALAGVGDSRNGEHGCASEERVVVRRKPKRIGNVQEKPRPRLFGGSLEEYVDATGESIPLLVTSAIDFLSKYALRHQGLFRVSGSQNDINRFKDAFERGEDAFSDLSDGSEANSVAGALKLYLRELREPLFPIYLFEQFTDCAKADTSADFVDKTHELIVKLPVCSILLLRYLFAFLAHLCEFADENMMEPHNMAICFGPTLLPIPDGKDQVFYHNFVNELVRALIVHHESVFPSQEELAGPAYNKYMIEQQHMEFADENDGLSSGDEDILVPSHAQVHTLRATDSEREVDKRGRDRESDQTMNFSCSTLDNEEEHTFRDMAFRDVFKELSSIQRGNTPSERSHPASLSSRCSSQRTTNSSTPHSNNNNNNSHNGVTLRRPSEQTVNTQTVIQRAESPNYVNQTTVWEQPSPAPSCSSSNTTTTQQSSSIMMPTSIITRPPVISLRDQLSLLRKEELASGGTIGGGGNKVYPAGFVSLSKSAPRVQRLSVAENGERVGPINGQAERRRESAESRNETITKELGDLRSRVALSSPLSNDLHEELKKVLTENEDSMRRVCDQPDIVREHVSRDTSQQRVSPPFDELERAIQAVQESHKAFD